MTRRISLTSSSTGTLPAPQPPGGQARLGPAADRGRAWRLACSQAVGWTDRKGSAWLGIVLAALLPSLLLWRYASSSGLTVYTYLST